MAPLDEPGEPERAAPARGECRRVDQRQRALPRQHEPCVKIAREMREAADHIAQPEWIATMPPESGRWVTRANPAASIIRAKAPGGGKRRIDSTRYW